MPMRRWTRTERFHIRNLSVEGLDLEHARITGVRQPNDLLADLSVIEVALRVDVTVVEHGVVSRQVVLRDDETTARPRPSVPAIDPSG